MKVIQGNWVLPNGNPVANGTLYLQLNQAGISAATVLTASGSTYVSTPADLGHFLTTVTITTTANHNLSPGSLVTLSGFSPSFINGAEVAVASVTGPTAFTIAILFNVNQGSGTGSGGTVTPLAVAAQVAPKLTAIGLDVNGSIPANTVIVANDELTPAGTFYRVSVEQSGGGRVYGPEVFSITGVAPINLNNLVPTV